MSTHDISCMFDAEAKKKVVSTASLLLYKRFLSGSDAAGLSKQEVKPVAIPVTDVPKSEVMAEVVRCTMHFFQ